MKDAMLNASCSHPARAEGEEMLSAVARHSRDIDEPAIRLVHEPRRVDGIFTGRASQALVSERSHGAVSDLSPDYEE